MADQVLGAYCNLSDILDVIEKSNLSTIPSDVNGVIEQLELLKVPIPF